MSTPCRVAWITRELRYGERSTKGELHFLEDLKSRLITCIPLSTVVMFRQCHHMNHHLLYQASSQVYRPQSAYYVATSVCDRFSPNREVLFQHSDSSYQTRWCQYQVLCTSVPSFQQVWKVKHQTGRDARALVVFRPRRRQEWREIWKNGRQAVLGIGLQEGLKVVTFSNG